jgi:hypothetical protein
MTGWVPYEGTTVPGELRTTGTGSRVTSANFDDPNLIASAGLVPVSRLAEAARLTALAQQHLSVPTDKGANAGMKVASLVTGMTAGADSIDLCRPRDYADKA